MKLTCVTATWNVIKAGNRESLIRCVKSVAALKTEHEHLIFDGASTDGTVELLRELERTTPGLKVVSEKDTGIYNALNKGVRDAKGEWFYVLGSDDTITHPEVMDRLVREASVDVDVIAAVVERDGDKAFFHNLDHLKHLFEYTVICHQGLIMRTHVVREFKGFDERYRIGADEDMILKAYLANKKFAYCFEPFANFAHGGTAESLIEAAMNEMRMAVRENLKISEARMQFYIDHWYYELPVILPLLSHKSSIVRKSARYMLWRNLRAKLRIALFPIVYMTRPVRRWLAQ